jgi:hypothetical protein
MKIYLVSAFHQETQETKIHEAYLNKEKAKDAARAFAREEFGCVTVWNEQLSQFDLGIGDDYNAVRVWELEVQQ